MDFNNKGFPSSFDIVHLPFDLSEATVEFIPIDTMKFTHDNNTYTVSSAEMITYGKKGVGINQTQIQFSELKNQLTSFFGQGGLLEIPSNLASVSFSESFLVTPLVFMIPNDLGPNAAYIRYNNITVDGFDAIVVEPPDYDGPHTSMTVPYYSFLPGKYDLGSVTIEVGFIDTKKVQGDYAEAGNEIGWDRVTLSQNYPNLSVITSIQTMNNEENNIPNEPSKPWITPTVKIVDDRTFDVTLDRSETSAGIVSVPERIGYIAFSANQQSSFTDFNSNNIFIETIFSNNIVGWDDNGGTNVQYVGNYSEIPLVLASINSRKSSEGGWLRYGIDDTTTSAVNLKIDHDSEQNAERNHTAEDAGILIISRDFILKNI